MCFSKLLSVLLYLSQITNFPRRLWKHETCFWDIRPLFMELEVQTTVDGWNPAPIDMQPIPLFTRFDISWVVTGWCRISSINSIVALKSHPIHVVGLEILPPTRKHRPISSPTVGMKNTMSSSKHFLPDHPTQPSCPPPHPPTQTKQNASVDSAVIIQYPSHITHLSIV